MASIKVAVLILIAACSARAGCKRQIAINTSESFWL
jgi:hypothetical protein